MKTLIELPKHIRERITYWHVVADIEGQIACVSSSYKVGKCKKPETALRRFKKHWGIDISQKDVKRILVRGLTMHGETKPLFLEEDKTNQL